jgi:hypothetical protein
MQKRPPGKNELKMHAQKVVSTRYFNDFHKVYIQQFYFACLTLIVKRRNKNKTLMCVKYKKENEK